MCFNFTKLTIDPFYLEKSISKDFILLLEYYT